MTNKMKIILTSVLAVSVAAVAATVSPVPYLITSLVGGVPTPLTSSLTSGQLNYTPNAILAKCMNGSLVVDCDFSGGGSFDPASPGPIGGTTPDVGTFTALDVDATTSGADATISLNGNGGHSYTLNAGGSDDGIGYSWYRDTTYNVDMFVTGFSQYATLFFVGQNTCIGWGTSPNLAHTNPPDTCMYRLAPGAMGVGIATTPQDFSATIQAGVTATDPGCTTTAHIGKEWYDTATTTTVYKVCLNVAGTVGWVTK